MPCPGAFSKGGARTATARATPVHTLAGVRAAARSSRPDCCSFFLLSSRRGAGVNCGWGTRRRGWQLAMCDVPAAAQESGSQKECPDMSRHASDVIGRRRTYFSPVWACPARCQPARPLLAAARRGRRCARSPVRPVVAAVHAVRVRMVMDHGWTSYMVDPEMVAPSDLRRAGSFLQKRKGRYFGYTIERTEHR